MKTLLKHMLYISFLVMLLISCSYDTNSVSAENDSILKSSQSGSSCDLSTDEVDGLVHMRMEEKLARDVYTMFGDMWNLKVFLNIKVSEQVHMDVVKKLLDKYAIADPLESDEPGVFPDNYFSALYNQLIAEGSSSVYDALKVGVSIEELDIADLQNQLDNVVNNSDILNVYTNLKDASSNHFIAFSNNLTGFNCVQKSK